MIKTIPINLDGFNYNIVQMNGLKAIKIKTRILNMCAGFGDIEKLSAYADTENILLDLAKNILGSLQEDKLLMLIKDLFADVRFDHYDGGQQETKFDTSRHPTHTINIEHFVGADLLHVYMIVFHVLKANFEDFLILLKDKVGSRFQSKKVQAK